MNLQNASTTRWYHRMPFVLLLLFVVMGPFALPFLWKSPAFSKTAKIILTALIIGLTVWLVMKIFHDTRLLMAEYADAYAAR